MFLEAFTFPDADAEHAFFMRKRANCYTSFYPYQTLCTRLSRIDFEPITVLSGSNGSGKSTALNVIAEKLRLKRRSAYNKTDFFMDYVDACTAVQSETVSPQSCILTSDDVFDYMLDLRHVNDRIDTSRDSVFDEYYRLRSSGEYSDFRFEGMEDYDKLKRLNAARKQTVSKFTRRSLPKNVRTHSNGETALHLFAEVIKDGGLYLLDEPENSLSPAKQLELAAYIEESALSFGCQFILSTHSLFFLSLRRAKVYDFDENPVDVKPWQELEVAKTYFDFFKEHESEFEQEW